MQLKVIKIRQKIQEKISEATIKIEKPVLQKFLQKPRKSLAERLKLKNTAYSNMMIFFNIKKFITKIHEKVRSMKKLTGYHLVLIGDKASDTQQLLQNIKLNRLKRQSQGSLFNFLRLMANNNSKVIQPPPSKSWKFKIKNFAQQSFEKWSKSMQKIIKKIPLIQPESTEKILWDILTALTRSTLLYLIPIEIAFKPNILFDKLLILTLITIIILILDLFVRLNTVCYVSGQAVRARWEIFTQQLKRTLWADMLSLTPLIISFLFEQMTILNLLFYLQFGHVRKVITQTEDQLHLSRQTTQIVNLSKFIITLLFVSHIFSCIWFFSASNYDDPKNWINVREIEHLPWFTQYLNSFYYSTVTMLTIGYGDIVPQNNLEKTLAIFFMLISCIWLSYSVNIVGTIVTALTQSGEESKRKMRLINRYMKQKNIGFALQFKIREYLSYCWAQENEIDLSEQRAIVQQLSQELKDELNEEAHSIFLKSSPLFKTHFSVQFKRKLMPYIKQQFFQPETIFDIQFQQQENNLCFIDQGSIQIYTGNYLKSEEDAKYTAIIKGSTIGLDEFISDKKPKESYKSLGFVALLTIPKSDFLTQIKDFPQDYEVYMNFRDLLIYNRVNNIQTVECNACHVSTHSFISCPLMHLNIDHERLLMQLKFPQNQQADKQFSRITCRQLYQSLTDKALLQEYFELFSSERAELIKNQAKLLPHSMDSDTQNESDNSEVQDFVPEPSTHLIMRQSQEVFDIIPSIVIRNSFIDSSDEPLSPSNTATKSKQKILRRQNTSAKIAQRYKNSLHKKQNEQMMFQYELMVQQFNMQQRKNILSIFQKCANNLEDIPLELEILKIKIENEQLPIFSPFQETHKLFSKYMTNNNYDKVLKCVGPIDQEITKQISHLLRYITYPWSYILKYKTRSQKKQITTIKIESPKKKSTQLKRTLTKAANFKQLKGIRSVQILPDGISPMRKM